MNDLIRQAENLKNAIKGKQKEINNPALVLGIISELDFFIDNVEENEEE